MDQKLVRTTAQHDQNRAALKEGLASMPRSEVIAMFDALTSNDCWPLIELMVRKEGAAKLVQLLAGIAFADAALSIAGANE